VKITYIKLDWTTLSPVSVSAPEHGSDAFDQRESAEVDLPVRRDFMGNPVIPGTSVAGALRAALPADARDEVMGAPSRPSPLSILGVEVGGGRVVETRHTAIDRRRGAARTHTLHSREAVAEGQPITVRLQLEHADDAPLATLLDALRDWRPRLGSGASVGRGSMHVAGIHHRTLDLALDEDLAVHLTAAGPTGFDTAVREGKVLQASAAPGEPLLDVSFAIVDALHIGSGAAKGDAQSIPFLTDSQDRPLVPGSSLKGLIRSRVEFLLRSLGGRACSDKPCGDCPTCQLFGYGGGELPDNATGVGRKSSVAFRNCAIDGAGTSERIHVSVDRFTGGALDGALYSDRVVDAGTFRIVVDPLHGTTPQWGQGLILAALIDLDEGLIGLGGSTTRGYGTVRADDGPLRDQLFGGRPASAIAREALAAAVAQYPAQVSEEA
jgi:CRISPR/Cas system CSM-associated protein Csm3 (group 7 of RAMP superfamily)